MREKIVIRLSKATAANDVELAQWVRMSEGNTTPIATSRLSELAELVLSKLR